MPNNFSNNASITPFDIAMQTDLIYNPDDNKYYESSDVMPYPLKEEDINKGFELKVEADEIIIKSDYDKISLEHSTYKQKMSDFRNRLKTSNYVNTRMVNYKFLGWKKNNKIRVIVQVYLEDNVYKVFDTTYDENNQNIKR